MTTKNGNLPAMPVMMTETLVAAADSGAFKAVERISGLKKREMFAMAAMQGLLSSGATYKGSTTNRHLLAADAVAHADALLAELEATK